MNFEQLIQAFEQTHTYLKASSVSAINQHLTICKWLFGQYIVEYAQKGEDQAKYGTELIRKFADRLSSKNIKGFTERDLRNCRPFYLACPQIKLVISDLALPETIWQSSTAKSE